MKFVSALVLLEQGKSIRCPDWPSGVSMKLHNGYPIVETSWGRRVPVPNWPLEHYLAIEWELYTEEKTDDKQGQP